MLGGQQGLIIAFVIALAINGFAYWFSDKMILAMYHAHEVTAEQTPRLHAIVRTLAERANLPMPKVYVIDSPNPNAFATGRNPKHAAVAVTTGILKLLTEDQLSGVIGHELAHVEHRDILISTVAATIAGTISFLATMARWSLIFGGGGTRPQPREPDRPAHHLDHRAAGRPVHPALDLAHARVRRRRARRATRRRIRSCSRAPCSGSSAAWNSHPAEVSPATAHMFIVSPFSAKTIALGIQHAPADRGPRRASREDG